MSYSNKQWSFLKDVSLLITFIAKSGWKATGGDLWRSNEEQNRLYSIKRSRAKAGESQHNNRMAIDLNFWDENGDYMPIQAETIGREAHDEKLKFIADYWESLHPKNKAGLYFDSIYDPYHFERGN